MDATRFEHSRDAWAAVDLTMVQKNVLDFGRKLGIFSALGAHRAVSPGVIATDRNIERLAQEGHRILLTVLGNKLESHPWARGKMPIAFFRLSRSCRTNSCSRFN